MPQANKPEGWISAEDMDKELANETKPLGWISAEDMDKKIQAETPSQLESLGRGAVQGLTLGFADEIEGAARSFLQGRKYEEARDEARKAYDAAEQANPTTYMASNIGGAILPSLAIPGGAGLTAGKLIASGAGVGAVSGLGGSSAQDVQGMAADTLKGAGIGAAGGAIGAAVSKAGPAILTKAAQGTANLLDPAKQAAASRALGLTKAIRNKMGNEEANAFTQRALDEGIIQPFSTTEDMLLRAQNLKQKAGEGIGNIRQELQASGKVFDTPELRNRLAQEFGKASKKADFDPRVPEVARDYQGIEDALTNFSRNQKIGAEDLDTLRQSIAKGTYNEFGMPVKNAEIYRTTERTLSNIEKEAIGEMLPTRKAEFDKFLQDYQLGKTIEKPLSNKIAAESGNQAIGLGGKVLGAGALASGNPLAAVGTMVGEKLAGNYASQTVAGTINSAQNALRKFAGTKFGDALAKAAKNGNNSLVVTYNLLKKNNPEFNEMESQ